MFTLFGLFSYLIGQVDESIWPNIWEWLRLNFIFDIILMVFTILVALATNMWNEWRRSKKEK